MSKRYVIFKYINDKWTPFDHFDAAGEAVNIVKADENDTRAVYDKQKQAVISFHIPKGSSLESLLKFAILKAQYGF